MLSAGSGGEALRLIEGHDGPVHLQLTDMIMPGMSGRDLAKRVAALRPGTKILFMSGYTDDAMLRHGVLEDTAHFIGKPYASAALTLKVRDVLDDERQRGG
ncbi:MAG: response regulator [Acidobacteria bacterium]|nr:response regulator [Acidobacteriota bacterium]